METTGSKKRVKKLDGATWFYMYGSFKFHCFIYFLLTLKNGNEFSFEKFYNGDDWWFWFCWTENIYECWNSIEISNHF